MKREKILSTKRRQNDDPIEKLTKKQDETINQLKGERDGKRKNRVIKSMKKRVKDDQGKENYLA